VVVLVGTVQLDNSVTAWALVNVHQIVAEEIVEMMVVGVPVELVGVPTLFVVQVESVLVLLLVVPEFVGLMAVQVLAVLARRMKLVLATVTAFPHVETESVIPPKRIL